MEKQINEVGTRLSEVSPEWWQQVAGGMKEAMNRKEKAWQWHQCHEYIWGTRGSLRCRDRSLAGFAFL